MKKKVLLIGFVAAILIVMIPISCFWASPKADPEKQGAQPCPDRPNCVSSRDIGKPSYIKPLCLEKDSAKGWEHLKIVITEMGGKIIKEQELYIWVSFSTAIFRFVDDVEFNLSPDEGVIHIRSESRLGYSDFGVNRKRLEELRNLLEQKMKEKE